MKRLRTFSPAFTHTFPAVREKKAQSSQPICSKNKGHCDRGPVDDTIEEPDDRQPKEHLRLPLLPFGSIFMGIV